MDTLLLDRTPWDFCMDAKGDIAMASAPYAIVQDVASACRLFTDELYYGGAGQGIPYFEETLGHYRPSQLLKGRLVEAALSVPGVLTARAFLTNTGSRSVGGQVIITTDAGSFTVPL